MTTLAPEDVEKQILEQFKPWATTEDNSADQDYIVGQSGSVQVIKSSSKGDSKAL